MKGCVIYVPVGVAVAVAVTADDIIFGCPTELPTTPPPLLARPLPTVLPAALTEVPSMGGGAERRRFCDGLGDSMPMGVCLKAPGGVYMFAYGEAVLAPKVSTLNWPNCGGEPSLAAMRVGVLGLALPLMLKVVGKLGRGMGAAVGEVEVEYMRFMERLSASFLPPLIPMVVNFALLLMVVAKVVPMLFLSSPLMSPIAKGTLLLPERLKSYL